MTHQNLQFAKFVALLNCAVPGLLLGLDALRGDLGANPVNFAIRTTGMLSLICLVLSLAVTPAARVSGWSQITHFRRMLGVYAFLYAAVHFGIFFGFDRAGSVSSTLSEMSLRPYLAVGAASLLMMAPLAATSTNGMIKRVGGKRWKLLHRLAYPAGLAAVTHYFLLVKSDTRLPMAFGATLVVLLGYRVFALRRKRSVDLNQRGPRIGENNVVQAEPLP
ncbi:MAG: sulfoxide reductase heme-binding subunit YedZ [Planctomycetota bacterium]|nr:sulfoxide reductase heme-binding subunit YedZ [Planctomycetota bacterium]